MAAVRKEGDVDAHVDVSENVAERRSGENTKRPIRWLIGVVQMPQSGEKRLGIKLGSECRGRLISAVWVPGLMPCILEGSVAFWRSVVRGAG
jgi:hypothetical protein